MVISFTLMCRLLGWYNGGIRDKLKEENWDFEAEYGFLLQSVNIARHTSNIVMLHNDNHNNLHCWIKPLK